MGDSFEPSNLHYGTLNGGAWESVGKPVELHVDDMYDDLEPYLPTPPYEFKLEAMFGDTELLHDYLELPNVIPHRGICFERKVFLSYPRTVRQAKARKKGNRGNRRREYETAVVQCVMHNVRIVNETA